MKKLKTRMVCCEHPYNSELGWLDNAQYVLAARKGFHAIIAKETNDALEGVLVAEDVEEDTPQFHVPIGMPVRRNADEMAKAVGLFLSTTRRVKFIDPYFSPDKDRYKRTLKAFLAQVNRDNCLGPVEFHLEDKGDALRSFKSVMNSIHELIPVRLVVRFYVWANVGREALHGRYILDSRMGFSFDHGLDDGRNSQSTDVTLISEEIRSKRWKDFDVDIPSGEYALSFSVEARGQVGSKLLSLPTASVI